MYWRTIWLAIFLGLLIVAQFVIIGNIDFSHAVACIFRGNMATSCAFSLTFGYVTSRILSFPLRIKIALKKEIEKGNGAEDGRVKWPEHFVVTLAWLRALERGQEKIDACRLR